MMKNKQTAGITSPPIIILTMSCSIGKYIHKKNLKKCFTLFKNYGLISLMNDTTVILQPNLTATNRTKDRIRQHGTPSGKDFKDGRGCPMTFTLMRRNDNAWPPSWLLQAEDGWLGWVPRNEIDVLNDGWRSLHKGK